MKKLLLLAIVALLVVGFSSNASAQLDKKTNADAKIITVLSIVEHSSLQFGSMSVNGGVGGTFKVSPEGNVTVGAGLNRSLSGAGVTAATYTVSGEADYTYSIALPSSILLKKVGDNSKTMTVDNFLAKSTSGTEAHAATGTLDGTGSEDFGVGATLNVSGTQSTGAYTGDFTITVAYN